MPSPEAAVPPLIRIPEERQRSEVERARLREELGRTAGRTGLTILAICAAWQLAGAGLMLLSARVTDETAGQALFATAFAVGYGGAFFTLVYYYVRGQERGEW